jgi:hypothetical protein
MKNTAAILLLFAVSAFAKDTPPVTQPATPATAAVPAACGLDCQRAKAPIPAATGEKSLGDLAREQRAKHRHHAKHRRRYRD